MLIQLNSNIIETIVITSKVENIVIQWDIGESW